MERRPPCQADSLDTLVRRRHSIRYYKDIDVDPQILRDCVALSQLAPSNSNMQPWRLTLARGPARERVVTSLRAEAQQKGPKIPPIPDQFLHFRSEIGRKVYGEGGHNIKKEDKEKQMEAVLRNYEFFGAPVCGVITMHHELTAADAMCVGMFIQTFVLALTERGLGTCLEISVTGYPEVLRKELKLASDQTILCGIAIGYPAEGNKINELIMTREDVDQQMTLLQE